MILVVVWNKVEHKTSAGDGGLKGDQLPKTMCIKQGRRLGGIWRIYILFLQIRSFWEVGVESARIVFVFDELN